REPSSIVHRPSSMANYLDSLVNKSLLRQEEQGEGLRFKMLETIREYGLEKLGESGEAALAFGRHAGFFLESAEQANAQMRGPYEAMWLDKLEAEHDNL